MTARKQRNSDKDRRDDAARFDSFAFVACHPSPQEIVADAICRLKSDLNEVFKTTHNA